MITLKPIVILSNRRKDGTYLVFIRVYHGGKCRRLPTNIVCRPGDITRSGRIKSQAVLDAASIVVDKMRESVSGLTDAELEGKDVDWVVGKIRCAERLRSFHLDFFTFADSVIASKTPGARGQYVTAVNTFAEFLGRREIDINGITRPLLAEFLSWMAADRVHFDSDGISRPVRARIPNGAESRNMAKLSHIFGKAKERYNDEDEGVILIPRSPFSGLLLRHPPSHGQKSLGVELMQRVIDARYPEGLVRTALDVFVLSFALMGANLADLYEAGEIGEVWQYRRKKTRTRRADGAEMRVSVPDVVRCRLPSLYKVQERDRTYITEMMNRGLARWCADEGVPVFTFYAARHTWATVARKAGVEKATIDECLCHIGDYKLTDIYVERDWEIMDGANRRVLELFRWQG